ncbi:membrane protein [Streptomyces sp. MMG1121]|nr:membrane protein [Streptomyces sp. MMG1121]
MGALAALILFAGVWGSWGTAQHVMLDKGREQGTVRVTSCTGDICAGPFTPTSAGARARARVELAESVAVRKGQTYDVVLKPGTADAVRSGPAGILYAWLPLGGALLLAAVVVAGGMRLTRVAWVLGLSGVGLLTAAFAAVQ